MRAPLRVVRREVRHPTLWRRLEIVLVAVIGAWLGLLAFGHVDASIGPVQARLAVTTSLHGDSRLDVAPLGSLTVDSHDGPVGLGVTVEQVNLDDARAIVQNPSSLQDLGENLTDDLRGGVVHLAERATVAALLGAMLLGVLVFRRSGPALWAGGVALALVAAIGVTTWATWNPRSVAEPKYTGLLAAAPSLVGSAQDIVSNFQVYEGQLAKIVTNVSRLYDTTSTLPVYEPGNRDTIKLLHVSDIHLNPAAWDIIRSVSRQFHVDLIVDSGDLSDHGTTPEDRWFTQSIGTLHVPYVFVRGNHDSQGTARWVARQPNAVVLRDEEKTVAGLDIYGSGDPRFTPDKSTRDNPASDLIQNYGKQEARIIASLKTPPDLAVVHDDEAARELAGTTPLVLCGHRHVRNTWKMHGGTRIFRQGSTGGSGLRALENEKPTPITLSVLYFDAQTKKLRAWDDITVGGLGLSSAEIRRHLADEKATDERQTTVPPPTPTGSVPGVTGPPGRPSPSGAASAPASAPASGSP